jgi:Gram-negative bacterial TonB protein C-terminal
MGSLRLLMIAAAPLLLGAAALGAAHDGPIPEGVILVRGAWSSAAGSSNALPEEGAVSDYKYKNAYFGLSYSFGPNWTQRYEGPPPSDGGYYVLAQLEPLDPSRNAELGHFLIAAQDLFFSATPARTAMEFVSYYQGHLGDEYRVERAPYTMRLANREFARLDYVAPVSGLHWHVLATEIRCHVLEFVYTGADARSLDRQVTGMNTLLQQGGTGPVCIKNFANAETIIAREDPVFTEPRFNRVPVRIVIDKEGKVKHIHFLSAFPEQAKSVADALSQWRFKPLMLNGQPVEVETDVVFGRGSRSGVSAQHQ